MMPSQTRSGSRSKSPQSWADPDNKSLLPVAGGAGSSSSGGSSGRRQQARNASIWDSPRGNKLFVVFVVFWYMVSGAGMVSQEHILLWTGVYKFNYPMFVTAAQLISAQVLLIFFVYVTRWTGGILHKLQLGFAVAPPDPPTQQKLHGWGWGPRGGVLEFEWQTGKKFIYVSAVFSLKILISNFAFAYAQFPVYQMSRILTIPIALFFATHLQSQTLPVNILSASLSVAFGLLTTSLRHVRFAPEGFIAGIFSSAFTALYPFTLLQAYNIMLDNLNNGNNSAVLSYEDHQRAFWRLLNYINTFSLMFILPLSLITGAWHEVYRTCYFLDAGFFWFMLSLSGLLGFICFVFMLGMVRCTSPLDAIVANGPRAAGTTALLSYFKMDIYSWVGFWLTWGSSFWYVKERREWKNSKGSDTERREYEMH